MVYKESMLKVVDNSQAILAKCIHVYKKKCASVGDLVLVTLRKVKPGQKIKKGDMYLAVVVATKQVIVRKTGMQISFGENAIVLLKKDRTVIGTRVKSVVSSALRKHGFLKIILLSGQGAI